MMTRRGTMATNDTNAELVKQLKQDIAAWESQTVEFKKTATSDHELARAIAGFATSNAGRIYVGVSDDRQIRGVDTVSTGPERDTYQRRIARISRDITRPPIRVKISFVEIESKTVVRIDVPKGDEPVYYADHRPYTRDLSTTRKLEPSELRALHEKKPIQVEVKYEPSPVLDLRPLPHYKGYGLPLKIEILPDLPNGKHQARGTNVGASTAEYNLLEISQKLEVYKGLLDQPLNELVAKFGVIRVRCMSGDAIGCKAEAKARIIQMYGRMHPTNFVDAGYLNWFSVAIKRDIQNKFDEIYPAKHLGLNKYLKNTNIDLRQGDEKDLLIFYMIKDLPNVFLCTDVESATAGSIFTSGQTLRFEVEIGITAQKYPRNTWNYFVTINDFDDFKIERR